MPDESATQDVRKGSHWRIYTDNLHRLDGPFKRGVSLLLPFMAGAFSFIYLFTYLLQVFLSTIV